MAVQRSLVSFLEPHLCHHHFATSDEHIKLHTAEGARFSLMRATDYGPSFLLQDLSTVDRSTPTYVRLPLALDDDVIEADVERLGRAYRGLSQADALPARGPRLVV